MKLNFHDSEDDDIVVYCCQKFSSDERLLTIGPSTDSAQHG